MQGLPNMGERVKKESETEAPHLCDKEHDQLHMQKCGSRPLHVFGYQMHKSKLAILPTCRDKGWEPKLRI